MTIEKARELYSEHREGKLDKVLAGRLESAMQSDPAIRADYQSFDRALGALESLRDEIVPEPFMLHERLSSRIDRSVVQASRAPSGFFGSWKFVALAAVAAATVTLIVVNTPPSSPRIGQANVIGAGSETPLGWTPQGRAVSIQGTGTLDVKDVAAGKSVTTIELGSKGGDAPIANSSQFARMFLLTSGDTEFRLAIPGREQRVSDEGSGTVEEFALAVADMFGVAVEVRSATTQDRVEWVLGKGEAVDARVSGASISVQKLRDGRLVIN